MRTRKEAREEILNTPIGDIISCFKDTLITADKNGSVTAVVRFSNTINYLNDIVDDLLEIEIEAGEVE